MKKLPALLFCLALLSAFSSFSYADGVSLSLVGAEVIDWPCGIPYTDEGCTACGADGSDLSGAICVSGEVNVMKRGEYTLCYSVTDDCGGSAEICRTVCVSPAALPEKHAREDMTIYLTYDDGPAKNTEELLELLDEYDAKATFFVIGQEAAKRPEVLKKTCEAGHSIGIHCDRHDYGLLYASEEYFLNDLFSAREQIFDITGQRPDIYRFPGGSGTAFQLSSHRIDGGFEILANDLADLGIEYFDWQDSADSKGTSPVDSVYRIIASAEKHGSLVVIQHDTRYGCIPATRRLLEMGTEKGFSFKALDSALEAVQFN